MAASVWPLKIMDQAGHSLQIVIGVAFVPDSQTENSQYIDQVVVHENRQNRRVWRPFTRIGHVEIKNVYRNDLFVQLVRASIPVLPHMESVLCCFRVEGAYDRVEIKRLAPILFEYVRPHAFTQ